MGNVGGQLALDGGPKANPEDLPFAGFGAELIGEEETAYVLEALRTRKLCRIAHPFDASFAHKLEVALRNHLRAPYALVLNSCASALHVALVALNIGPGDEVLVAGAGWFAVAAAVINVGAVPVPVEYDENLTMDMADLERKATPRTRAVIVVHWRGLPADMDALMKIAQTHDLRVIEDVAQSFGATYRGRALGTIGDVGCYSFNMHKVVSGGEGGAVVMNDRALYKRAVSFSGMYNMYIREYDDGERRSMPRLPMLNFRMPELCAAVVCAQLAKVDRILGVLRVRSKELESGILAHGTLNLAKRYDSEGDCGYTLPIVFSSVEKAEFFFRAMRAEGATNVSNLAFGFGGGEAKGTAELVASEGLDPRESGEMVLAHTWRCLTERVGPSDALDPWKLRDKMYGLQASQGERPTEKEIVPRSLERLRKVVALKTNVLLTRQHTERVILAMDKVVSAMRERFPD